MCLDIEPEIEFVIVDLKEMSGLDILHQVRPVIDVVQGGLAAAWRRPRLTWAHWTPRASHPSTRTIPSSEK